MYIDLGCCFFNWLDMIGYIECLVFVLFDGFCIVVEYSLVDFIDSSLFYFFLELNFIVLLVNNKIVFI